MELLQLEYFEKVARFNSVSKAASELCISQSSLSGCILRLEKELGMPLFERKHRKMILTSYGEYFLSVTREILRLLSASRLSFEAQLPARISVAFLNYSEELLQLIQRFQKEHQNVNLMSTAARWRLRSPSTPLILWYATPTQSSSCP